LGGSSVRKKKKGRWKKAASWKAAEEKGQVLNNTSKHAVEKKKGNRTSEEKHGKKEGLGKKWCGFSEKKKEKRSWCDISTGKVASGKTKKGVPGSLIH